MSKIIAEDSDFKFSYDGCFEGLVSAIYRSLQNNEHPSSIEPAKYCQTDLFNKIIFVPTDSAASEIFSEYFCKIAGEEALIKIFQSFLSENKNIEGLICRYIELAFQKGYRINNMITHTDVQQIEALSLNVGRESHRYLGFVRFSEICNSILYSSISPVNNILGLIAPHFADRLKGCKWLIYDTKREIAAVSDGKSWLLTDNIPDGIIVKTDEEAKWQTLWSTFFNAISIEGRYNPKLQNKLMPKRFRMTERYSIFKNF